MPDPRILRRIATDGMTQPVRCNRCHNGIYDLGAVEVTARYTDCSMWRTPCCDALVDDRGDTGWKPFKDYERIDPNNPNPYQFDIYGMEVRRG